jgi:hypothetical protein
MVLLFLLYDVGVIGCRSSEKAQLLLYLNQEGMRQITRENETYDAQFYIKNFPHHM